MKFNFFLLVFFLLYCNLTFADIKTNYLIINKSSRQLVIFLNNGEIKSFSISLGFEPYGTKVKKGDGKTPEGLYYIENKIKESSFYLALQISYPNPWDIRRALSLNTHPGGQIMIHGLPNSGYDKSFHNKYNDWTEGCVAIKNNEMDFLWNKVNIGTPVFIRK
jgi:murein L,D-transpeptidase YafK